VIVCELDPDFVAEGNSSYVDQQQARRHWHRARGTRTPMRCF
jgi:hypothetical protein